jgi:hypothetical protein
VQTKLLLWSQLLSLIWSAAIFYLIRKYCQLNPDEEAHYPKVKEVARSKPRTPWITADHYKRRKCSNVNPISPAQKQLLVSTKKPKPKSRDKKKKKINTHTKTLLAKLQETSNQPHSMSRVFKG